MLPALITHDGRVLSDTKETPPSKVEEDAPLHVIAAREAARQSTKKHQQRE